MTVTCSAQQTLWTYLLEMNLSCVLAWEPCCGTTRTGRQGWPLLCTPGAEGPLQTLLGPQAGGWCAAHSLSPETDCCCSLQMMRYITHHQMEWNKGKKENRRMRGGVPGLEPAEETKWTRAHWEKMHFSPWLTRQIYWPWWTGAKGHRINSGVHPVLSKTYINKMISGLFI